MANYNSLQFIVDNVRGVAAAITGQPFNIYRLNSASNSVIDPSNLIFNNFSIYRERLSELDPLEGPKDVGTIWFKITCNGNFLKTGDIAILNDSFYGAGATYTQYPTFQYIGLYIAFHPPLRTFLAGRLDRNVQLYRPNLQPMLNGKFDSTLANALPLQLNAGTWGLGTPGNKTATPIPAGFSIIIKPMNDQFYQEMRRVTPGHVLYKIYLPVLENFRVTEGDFIIDTDGSQYTILNPWYQEAGALGGQYVAIREASSN